jgi:hypothetical protein
MQTSCGPSTQGLIKQAIEVADWKSPTNFIDDNILKQILGFDASLFNVDMLQMICNNLGFVSWKFTKAACVETIIKAYLDGEVYDSLDPASSIVITDSTSHQCRLINAVLSDIFVPRLQYLGARKEILQLCLMFIQRKNIQNYLFAHCWTIKYFLKKVDPSCKSGKTSSWEALHKMLLKTQKDYKLKHQRYKLSGNHSNAFIDFCHGRLGTYYLQIWLNKRDPNLLLKSFQMK